MSVESTGDDWVGAREGEFSRNAEWCSVEGRITGGPGWDDRWGARSRLGPLAQGVAAEATVHVPWSGDEAGGREGPVDEQRVAGPQLAETLGPASRGRWMVDSFTERRPLPASMVER